MTDTFELTPAPNAWPLLFKHRSPVLGNGFVALVEMHGRLLARPDAEQGPDGIWIDGVNPGALALPAENIRSASHALRSALTGVLVDFAEEASSFDDFKAAVEEFFRETDAETVGEWEACVAEVQSGRLSSPGLLPVLSANVPLLVQVTRKSTEAVTPKDNSAPEPVLASVA
jgi:hypothetical protein